MGLSSEDARVLASLMEKESTVPDSYPMSLNALRLACNQSTNRAPIVAFEDRTVEAALLSLKSIGLVRFVLPSHGGRTIRYRHVAGERWHLSAAELAVLSVLVLRGPQTVNEVRSRVSRQHRFENPNQVDEILDTLASRSPEALAVRLQRRPGERDERWADLLTGEVPDMPTGHDQAMPPGDSSGAVATDDSLLNDSASLAVEVAGLHARLDHLERLLGVEAPTEGA